MPDGASAGLRFLPKAKRPTLEQKSGAADTTHGYARPLRPRAAAASTASDGCDKKLLIAFRGRRRRLAIPLTVRGIASTPTPSTRRLLDSAVHRLPNLGLARGDEALLPPHEDRRAPREGGRRPPQLRRQVRVHALSGGRRHRVTRRPLWSGGGSLLHRFRLLESYRPLGSRPRSPHAFGIDASPHASETFRIEPHRTNCCRGPQHA